MNTLETEHLPINKDQWLSDTEKFKNGTPSNYIIFKVLPGKGATHWECLYKERNSIILEFNTPVLEGKRDALHNDATTKMYPNILSVFQGVEEIDVIKYLKSEISPKKILCTPHAYIEKVKPAIEKSGFNLYEDFFMLIDECDKLTTDSDFRTDITLPIDDFFNFNTKAMISATAMNPSDPRFSLNGFKILKIQPSYDYKKKITLINTNNVIYALVKKLLELKDNKVFIFLNSTDLIHEIINVLGIHDHSKVHCAENSVVKLRKMSYRKSSTTLGEFAQYNFFTSRFFSAVDIKIDDKPDVILVSHIYRASFTMLDPYTDSVQIEGRLRNGISSITHISNFNSKIESKNEMDARKAIADKIQGYRDVKQARDKALLEPDREVTVFDQLLENSDYSKYIKYNGETNYFMLDNFILDEKIKGYYLGKDELEEAYIKTEYFIPIRDDQDFLYTDNEIFSEQRQLSKKELNKKIATGLYNAECSRRNGLISFDFDNNPYDLRRQHPEFSKIYDTLGFQKIEALGFEDSKLKAEYKKVKEKQALKNTEFLAEITSLYVIGDRPLKSDFLKKTEELYKKYNIQKKPKASDISEYYDAYESTTSTQDSKLKIWVITGIKEI
ncbi:MAG: hypothetical protein WC623_13545 [Pedobacter sp.]|uniref:hypothetical protein n=1 Tax=Pedobacter sp. TaxID=1411316 RepID=UPI003567A37D